MVTFIKPSDVIKRIRSTIALAEANLDLPEGFVSYAQRVGGSSHIADITEENVQALPTPSCFVTLEDGTANTNRTEVLEQDLFDGFNITIILDAVDRRKQTAEEHIVIFKELLLYCLNGWSPSGYPSASPLRFVTDYTAFSGRDKYVRVFKFMYDTRFAVPEDLIDTNDYDLRNFEKFISDLLPVENKNLIVGEQNIDLYEG